MPNYEFYCETCEGKFEAFRRYTEVKSVRCPACHGEVKLLPSRVNHSFGWRLADESHLPGNPDRFVKNV